MKKLVKLMVAIGIILIANYTNAQFNCSGDYMLENYSGENQNYPAAPNCPELDHDFTIEIPVVVHIMYNEDFENVDYQQVVDMINTANNQLITDNVDGHNVNISLKLVDNGTCEPGYNKVSCPEIG